MSEKILLTNTEEQNLVLNNHATDNENFNTIVKCYQCILCSSSMFFQRKRIKNRLWGLRVSTTNLTSSSPNEHNNKQQPYHSADMPFGIGVGDEETISDTGSFLCCGTNGETMFTTTSPPPSVTGSTTDQLFMALMKKLTERQLQTLCQALDRATTYDGQVSNCVLVPRSAIFGEDPHVIACRLWRWADLRYAEELKRSPSCPNEIDPIYVCCNPTHWYRHYRTDSPPPPYSPFAMDRLKSEDRTPNKDDPHRFPGSLSTDGEDASSSTGWCQLAYWEQSQRVGRLFPVENAAVNVFGEQPRGDGLCLTTLALQRLSATPDAVLKTRQKIGLGVTLSREPDGMWLYNRSSAPVFVHSPTLSDMDSRTVIVYRVPPGHCLRAFDHLKAAAESFQWQTTVAGAITGPIDKYSVRISFAKGWGPNYQRKEVKSCPCWLEVLLSPCR